MQDRTPAEMMAMLRGLLEAIDLDDDPHEPDQAQILDMLDIRTVGGLPRDGRLLSAPAAKIRAVGMNSKDGYINKVMSDAIPDDADTVFMIELPDEEGGINGRSIIVMISTKGDMILSSARVSGSYRVYVEDDQVRAALEMMVGLGMRNSRIEWGDGVFGFFVEDGRVMSINEMITDHPIEVPGIDDGEVLVYRIPSNRFGAIHARFHATPWRKADTVYLLCQQEGNHRAYDVIRDSAMVGVAGNKVVGIKANSRTKEYWAPYVKKLAEYLGADAGDKMLRIKPGSRFHKMLAYVAANPGTSRSGWYVKHLGLQARGMPGFTADTADDGKASRLGLITHTDPGVKSQYALRITSAGQKVLDRLNAGETITKI